jgi:excisionase family DNA binding protein
MRQERGGGKTSVPKILSWSPTLSAELLTADELAARLRVKPDTIKQWARRGHIPTVRFSPKVVRFNLSAVLAAIERQNQEARELTAAGA